jgi:hypothetical protein
MTCSIKKADTTTGINSGGLSDKKQQNIYPMQKHRKNNAIMRNMIESNSGVSSNRSINVVMVLWMLGIMTFSLIFGVELELLKIIMEYSFYIYGSSLSLKSVEKVTAIIKSKNNNNNNGNYPPERNFEEYNNNG